MRPLRDAGIKFVATAMPMANPMTVGVMSVVAENIREGIPQNRIQKFLLVRQIACANAP